MFAATIARRPFLPDEQRPWVERERERLGRVWRRATLVLADVSVRNREFDLGIHHATEALTAEPFDETACRTLMRAARRGGNRAEALRVCAKMSSAVSRRAGVGAVHRNGRRLPQYPALRISEAAFLPLLPFLPS